MKRWKKVLAVIAPLTLAMSFTSLAGEWQEDMVGWKYENDDGSYITNGWHWVDGNGDGIAECYYFNLRGYVVDDFGKVDGYEINKDGAWTVNGVVQTKAVPLPNDSEAMALYLAAAEKNADLDSIDTTVKMNMTMAMDGSSALGMDMDINLKMRGAKTGDLEYVMDGSMNTLGMEVPYSAFYTDGYIYTDTLGVKTKQATSVYDAIASANSTMDVADIDTAMITDMQMQTDGENTVLTYTIDRSRINSYLNELMGMDMFSDLEDLGFQVEYDIRSADGTIVIDSSGYYTKETINMDMGMTMTDTGTGEVQAIDYTVDMDMTINNPGEPVEFTLPSTEGYEEVTAETFIDLTEVSA